ncbi:lysosome membrane protein 2 [Galendromus occidentalis]|uniref:Lysosome membrane protein 2 n=1 Tax=Galendromus occidentalis TaxID=34638 RepID=A0AAJ6QSN3_9ACAR|nr:lysosome membrane protein 2 [Galendromus occidentalis]
MFLTGLPRWATFILLIASLVLFSLGITGFIVIPNIIGEKISEQMRLVEDSPTLSRWANVSVPIYFSVYVFNVTNPSEFMAGEKPIVQEVGPFTFIQKRRKIIQNIDADSVNYLSWKSFIFHRELSSGSLDDMIYTLNIPLIAMDKLVSTKVPGDLGKSLLQPILEGLLDKHNEKLLVHRRVNQMLFEGYDVPMLTELAKLATAFIPDAKFPASKRFGLLYNKNNTADQSFTVGTGAGKYPFTNILDWNNNTELEFWGNADCNRINGTDGGQFPPFVRTSERLYAFATDLCRSIYFEYEKPSDVNGLDTKRFTIPASMFASGNQIEENRCFCEHPDKCREGGVINVSKCRRGAPLIMSAPHFYLGEDKLIDEFEGLSPNKEKHETFLDVMTMTGLVLRAAKRLQINIDLKRSDLIYPLENITDRIFPIAWIEELVEVPSKSTNLLQEKLVSPHKMGILVSSLASCAGAIGGIASILVFVVLQSNSSRTAKLYPVK